MDCETNCSFYSSDDDEDGDVDSSMDNEFVNGISSLGRDWFMEKTNAHASKSLKSLECTFLSATDTDGYCIPVISKGNFIVFVTFFFSF